MASPKRADLLPIVSELSKDEMLEAINLLQDYLGYSEQIEAIKAEQYNIKAKLLTFCELLGKGGLRWGQLACYHNGKKTKKTLSKTKLLENQVSIETINASYSVSKPYVDMRIVDLSKPRAKRSDDDDDDEED